MDSARILRGERQQQQHQPQPQQQQRGQLRRRPTPTARRWWQTNLLDIWHPSSTGEVRVGRDQKGDGLSSRADSDDAQCQQHQHQQRQVQNRHCDTNAVRAQPASRALMAGSSLPASSVGDRQRGARARSGADRARSAALSRAFVFAPLTRAGGPPAPRASARRRARLSTQ